MQDVVKLSRSILRRMLAIQQGNLWVAPLPEGDWSKAVLQKPGKDKKKEKEAEKDGSKEGSKRGEATKNVLEITPVWRHVVLKEGTLVLQGADGIEEHISLEGCEVLTVSAGSSPGGKWYVLIRFPVFFQTFKANLYLYFSLDIESMGPKISCSRYSKTFPISTVLPLLFILSEFGF